jgi:hypothetical protein
MNVTKAEHINENFINSNYLESREIVKADFNQIEALIKSSLSPEEFLKSYWLEVLKCYKALEDYRDERSMEYFNDLMKRAEEYRKTHHNKVSPPQTMSKDKFKEILGMFNKFSYNQCDLQLYSINAETDSDNKSYFEHYIKNNQMASIKSNPCESKL